MSQGRAVAVREPWYAVGALRAGRRSRAAVERRALRGIRRMIEHARREVPHYRDPAYAVRQDDEGLITVSIVFDHTGGRSSEDVTADVRTCVHRQLDLQLPMHVVPGERIELTPGGKARLVSSG